MYLFVSAIFQSKNKFHLNYFKKTCDLKIAMTGPHAIRTLWQGQMQFIINGFKLNSVLSVWSINLCEISLKMREIVDMNPNL